MNDEQTKDQPAETQSAEVQPVDPQSAELPAGEPPAPEAQPRDPRRRLRELIAIPERERSDAVWDEINALEIQLAPGNRAPSPQDELGRHNKDPGRRQDQGRRQEQRPRKDASSGAKPSRRFHRKPGRGPGGSGKT